MRIGIMDRDEGRHKKIGGFRDVNMTRFEQFMNFGGSTGHYSHVVYITSLTTVYEYCNLKQALTHTDELVPKSWIISLNLIKRLETISTKTQN